jgi:hypothetical protein
VLSDVYYPTTDNTNVKTVQYIVTDGRTFTDLQTRDMTYTVRALDGTGMACQVTSTAKSGAYRLITDYITDPQRDSVVMHTSYVPLNPAGPRLSPLRALQRPRQRHGRRREPERRGRVRGRRPGQHRTGLRQHQYGQ